MFRLKLLCVYALLTSPLSHAHEYWLDPIYPNVKRGEKAIIDVRNGENFSGSAFPYDASNFQNVVIGSESETTSYTGRLGDYPALHPRLNTNGLHSVSVETTAKLLTYNTWNQFLKFLNYHGLENIEQRHRQRGLKENEISERYFRSAKTFLHVSDSGEQALKPLSAPIDVSKHNAFTTTNTKFEMLLLNNPYSSEKTISVQLLYDKKPLTNRQVELFWRGSTEIRLTNQTDNSGKTTFKILGNGDYLLNAVHVTIPGDNDVDWLSYWASITFER